MTTTPKTPAPPGDLSGEGRRLWRALHRWLDDQRAALDPHERTLVEELCRGADRLATIRGALAGLEPTDPAWTRLASEERQRTLAQGRLISAVGFPTGLVDEATGKGGTPRSRRAQSAAQQRWAERTKSARRQSHEGGAA